MKNRIADNQSPARSSFSDWAAIGCAALAVLMFLSFKISSDKCTVFIFERPTNALLYLCGLVGIGLILNKVKGILFSGIGVFTGAVIALLSSLFSLLSVLSLYFEKKTEKGLGEFLQSSRSVFSFVAAFLGGVVLFFIIICMIWQLSGCFTKMKPANKAFLSAFFGEHLYRNCLILIAVCWLPQYIIRFPGVVPYDTWQSLAMHMGTTEMTTQHPLIWGSLVGKLTEFGVKIGISWLAPLVVCLVLHVLCAVMVAYTVSTLKKFRFNAWFLGGVLAFFIVLPPMHIYASTLYNDGFYGLAIMLLTVELMCYIYCRKAYFSSIRHLLLTALAVFGTIMRYNGLYTMLAVVCVVALRELYLLIKRDAKILQTIVILLLCMIIPLSCGQIIQNALNEHYEATEIRSRAMFAMPIQQTVRCLIEHGEDIPEEDYKAIHAVLTWSDEKYEKKYDPRNFDGVKESFKNDATGAELIGFFKAWLKLVIRYPQTCFMATANQTYYLFSPLVENVRYYKSIWAHSARSLKKYNFDAKPYLPDFPVLKELCDDLYYFEEYMFPSIPVVGLVVNSAVYTILLLAIFLSALLRKDKRPLILTVALLVTLAITFVGPAVYNHPRYIYPIMYSMPVLIAAFMLPMPKKSIKATEENS